MAQYPKRIPYGMMDFVDVREDNCYYVDKTRFIPLIEQANKFFFFFRPRRFGKSLTLSMLRHYYAVLRSSLPGNGYGSLRRNQLRYYLFGARDFPLTSSSLHSFSKNVRFFITFMPLEEQRLEIIVNFVANNINRKGD